jgi:amino acid transporter
MTPILDKLNELINIPTKEGNLPIVKIVLLFYLTIMSQFAGGLMPSQLIRELHVNRTAQHLVGLTTIFVMINLLADVSLKNNIGYAFICYALFLMTTKMDLMWSMIILGGGIMYYMTDEHQISQEEEQNNDLSLPDLIKNVFLNNHKKIRIFAFTSLVILIFFGLNAYNTRKMNEYQFDYDPIRFILGASNKPGCLHCGHANMRNL